MLLKKTGITIGAALLCTASSLIGGATREILHDVFNQNYTTTQVSYLGSNKFNVDFKVSSENCLAAIVIREARMLHFKGEEFMVERNVRTLKFPRCDANKPSIYNGSVKSSVNGPGDYMIDVLGFDQETNSTYKFKRQGRDFI